EDVPSYFGRVLAGGFPLAVEKTKETSRRRWFNNYVDDVCSRAAEVERVRGVRADATHDRVPSAAALMAVFRAAAGITAQLLNVAHIGRAAAAQLGLEALPSWATVQRWLEILESVHLLVRIEAWGTTLRARTVRTPKVHVVDSGLAAHFVGVTSENL